MRQRWAVMAASADAPYLNDLFEEGWEPFAVTREECTSRKGLPYVVDRIWLRRLEYFTPREREA